MNSSKRGLAEFRAALTADPAMQADMRARNLATEADVAAFAAERGFSFSADEIRSLTELTEAELERVTGGAAFVKFDGVDGEATDANHDKWIDVLSVRWK